MDRKTINLQFINYLIPKNKFEFVIFQNFKKKYPVIFSASL